ncbi:MAG: cytochrome c3 family protein [Thermodesulfobacteriota bacterium]
MSRMTGIPLLIFFLLTLSLVPGHADPTEGEAKCQCPCPCPEASVSEPSGGSAEVPEEVVLDKLVEVYEAVPFSHAEHADMVDDGCPACHHHAPPGVYQKCGACHEKRLFEEDKLNMINLKAAYHRQCIGCHVEWESGPTGCTECHEIRE